jgi:hypothetical protein
MTRAKSSALLLYLLKFSPPANPVTGAESISSLHRLLGTETVSL